MIYLQNNAKVPFGQSGHTALSTPYAYNRHDWQVFLEPEPACNAQKWHRKIPLSLFDNHLIDRFDFK